MNKKRLILKQSVLLLSVLTVLLKEIALVALLLKNEIINTTVNNYKSLDSVTKAELNQQINKFDDSDARQILINGK